MRNWLEKITNYNPLNPNYGMMEAQRQYDIAVRRYMMTRFTEDGTEMPEPTGIDKVLQERKSTYGDYSTNARVTQGIMKILRIGENVQALNDMHLEGLHMIAHKMSRIVNGDPDHKDSWDDIAGYAKCVADRIKVKS